MPNSTRHQNNSSNDSTVYNNYKRALTEMMERPIQLASHVTRPETRSQRLKSCKAIRYLPNYTLWFHEKNCSRKLWQAAHHQNNSSNNNTVYNNYKMALPEMMGRPIQFASHVTRPEIRPQRLRSCKVIRYRQEGRRLALAKITPRCTDHETTKWASTAQWQPNRG